MIEGFKGVCWEQFDCNMHSPSLFQVPTSLYQTFSLWANNKADVGEWAPLHWIQGVLCCTKFSTWQPNNLISNIRLVSDSRNKRITSKLCFISSRLQSGTMNNRSQGTKTEIEKLSSFYVSAVVRIHRELIKIHWLVTVLILWLLSVKWLS